MGNMCGTKGFSASWQYNSPGFNTCSFTKPGHYHVETVVYTGTNEKCDDKFATIYTPYDWIIPTSYKPRHWPNVLSEWCYEIKEYEFRSIIECIRRNVKQSDTQGLFQFAEWLEYWENKCVKISRKLSYV